MNLADFDYKVPPMEDPEEVKYEHRLSKAVNKLSQEVKDRFCAVKVIQDQSRQIDDEEEYEFRQLEIRYEQLYQESYKRRHELTTGQCQPDKELVDMFDVYAKAHAEHETFTPLQVEPCDTKSIQNSQTGVAGFWLKAMCSHKEVNTYISEKDRVILQYLQDVRVVLHEQGFGFDLEFYFEENSYFKNKEPLKKCFTLIHESVITKATGTTIEWEQGADPTHIKKKKKNKSKNAAKKTTTQIVKQPSFFNFFEDVKLKMPRDIDKALKEDDDDVENGAQMDVDFSLGQMFREDLIPLALEYYLNVVEQPELSDDEDVDKEEEKVAKSTKKGSNDDEEEDDRIK